MSDDTPRWMKVVFFCSALLFRALLSRQSLMSNGTTTDENESHHEEHEYLTTDEHRWTRIGFLTRVNLCPSVAISEGENRGPYGGNIGKHQRDHLVLLVGGNPLPNAVAGKLLAASGGTITLLVLRITLPPHRCRPQRLSLKNLVVANSKNGSPGKLKLRPNENGSF